MFDFLQNIFKDKNKIFSVVAILFGLLSIILFIVLPVVVIGLTPYGLEIAKNTPGMVGYSESIGGATFLIGGSSVNIWETSSSGNLLVGVEKEHAINFNPFALAGLVLILFSTIGLVFQLIKNKNNILNKFILAGYIVGSLLILLTPVWFYAVNNTILASSRYDTATSLYIHGGVNANIGIGAVLSTIFGIISSIAAGALIIKPQEKER